MKRALLLLTACTPDIGGDPPYRLDHDRIVAVRATPPHLIAGQIGQLDALLAHADSALTIGLPQNAAAPFSPLFAAIHFNVDHWQIDAPTDAELAAARVQLGLAPDALVPLDITMRFPGGLVAQKTVWFGDTHDNPALPGIVLLDPVRRGDTPLGVAPPPGGSVRWFTSCGTLEHADQPDATLTIDEACTGELAVVLRDSVGGVTWQVLPLHAP